MGSGTTLRACKDLHRKFIGVEISKDYCDIAVKRLAQEVLF
jgi:DNA modification methylase